MDRVKEGSSYLTYVCCVSLSTLQLLRDLRIVTE